MGNSIDSSVIIRPFEPFLNDNQIIGRTCPFMFYNFIKNVALTNYFPVLNGATNHLNKFIKLLVLDKEVFCCLHLFILFKTVFACL